MKYAAGIIFLFALMISSCSENDSGKAKFIKTYKEILIVRELYSDSSEAALKVNETFKQNGYTEPEFRKEFMKFAADKDEFVRIIDKLREEARIEAQKAGARKPDKE